MSYRYLADIPNPQTRIAEFEFRLREGTPLECRRVVLEAMADIYPPLRHQAGLQAAEMRDEALNRVLRALAVGDAEAAVEAVVAMGLDAECTPAPLAAVRQVACMGLEGAPDAQSIAALMQAGSDEDPDVRYRALIVLYELGATGEAFADLVAQRLMDPDPEVVVVAAQIVSHSGWAELTAPLVEQWRKLHGSNKFQLALCLSDLVAESQVSLEREILDAIVDQLLAALKDEITTSSAIHALQKLRVTRAREPLEKIVSGWFTHPIMKVEAAGALYMLGSPAGEKYLKKALGSSRKDARGYALRTVGRLHIEAFFSQLKFVARSPEYHADTAVLALADYGGEDARAVLAEVALNHAQHEVRSLASKMLDDWNI